VKASSKRRVRWLAAVLTLLLSAGAGAAVAVTVTVTDDLDHPLELARPAGRIVSLSPHATELLFAAGAGDKVVGVVSHSDYPPAARSLPRVGGYKSIDLEALLALEPDLVVAWHSGNGEVAIERLRRLGLKVFVTEPRRLEDIPSSIERLGELAGTQGKAGAAAEAFRGKQADLAARHSRKRPVRVFYQVWNRPLMTVNGQQLISQVLRLCGGRNVFAELPALSAAVDLEAVLGKDPEAIVASGMGEERPEWLEDWRRWPSLTAVKRDNLFFVPPDLIQRHSPRVLEGAQLLCRQLDQARAKGAVR
jgi:iron complex transport system substrate-binding protein